MKISTKKLTTLAVTVATAMILSFVESQIPAIVPIPGVKLGLANIAKDDMTVVCSMNTDRVPASEDRAALDAAYAAARRISAG